MKIKSRVLIIIILLIMMVFTFFNTFETVENRLRDSYLDQENSVDTRIIILGIDDESLAELGQWPWPRNYHAEVIAKLIEGGAAAIGLDIMLPEPARYPEEDQALVEVALTTDRLVVPVFGLFERFTGAGQMDARMVSFPIPELAEAATLAHINTFPEPDGIVRRALTNYDYEGSNFRSFSYMLYRKYCEYEGIEPLELSEIPLDRWNRYYVDFTGEPGTFEHLPYLWVLNGDIPPEYFEGKIVMIGPYAAGIEDYYFTPLDYQTPMYGVEVHANILQTFLDEKFKQEVPFGVNVLILLVLGAFSYYIFHKLSPIITAFVLAVISVVYLFAARQIFLQGKIIALIYPLVLIALIYLVLLAYRYIEEMLERRRVTDVFGRYVAPQVVDQILNTGEEGLKLGGSRREISVLFVDIRGFTPMSEKAEPEEVVEILNLYLNLTAQSIFKFDGTLDKFIGDATMAIFNAPLDVPDHAFKAAQAAEAMRDGSVPLEKELERRFGRTVHFGIGVNTGYAVVGNIGAEVRMDYTAIGDTVNTAARLESNAKPGQILLSQATYERIKDRVEVTPLGTIKVKGKEEGIEIFQLEKTLMSEGEVK